MANDAMYFQCTTKAEFDLGTLTGSFQPLNGTGFDEAAKVLKIWNPSTTVSIDVSLDGVTAHDFIPPLATLIVDFQANHADSASFGTGTMIVRKGQILYGRTAVNPTYLQIIGYY
jgi:hypothetical protein